MLTLKKTAYSRRAPFSPFIATCDVVLDNEAEGYLKRLLLFLQKMGPFYCRVVGWLRARIQIYMPTAISQLINGFEETEQKTKVSGTGAEDYAGL